MPSFVRVAALVAAQCYGFAWSAAAQPPPAPPPPPCAPSSSVVCGQSGAEDLVALGPDWVIASVIAAPGGVMAIRARDRAPVTIYPAANAQQRVDKARYPDCPGPPNTASFTTHGVYVEPGSGPVYKLFTVAHGARESIEIFEVDTRPATPVATWVGCVVAPDPIGLNSVRGLPDGGFITTNFLPRGGTPEATQRMLAGEKNGELWEWHTATGWVKVPGSETAGANGARALGRRQHALCRGLGQPIVLPSFARRNAAEARRDLARLSRRQHPFRARRHALRNGPGAPGLESREDRPGDARRARHRHAE